MTLPRARIIGGNVATQGQPLLAPGPGAEQRRRISREEIEARLAAYQIVRDAEARAQALLSQAREEAKSTVAEARRDARDEAEARLAAQWLALHRAQEQGLQQNIERVSSVGVALAERLLGTSLRLDPSRIADLARAVLAEARGARQAIIEAHPLDSAALERDLSTAGLDVRTIEIRSDDSLARGDLRLHTDLGTIDAKLASRLERLASALRDALE